MSCVPASLTLAPIDAAARDGSCQLLFGRPAGRRADSAPDRTEFALARWSGEGWLCASGVPLHFTPESYRP